MQNKINNLNNIILRNASENERHHALGKLFKSKHLYAKDQTILQLSTLSTSLEVESYDEYNITNNHIKRMENVENDQTEKFTNYSENSTTYI